MVLFSLQFTKNEFPTSFSSLIIRISCAHRFTWLNFSQAICFYAGECDNTLVKLVNSGWGKQEGKSSSIAATWIKTANSLEELRAHMDGQNDGLKTTLIAMMMGSMKNVLWPKHQQQRAWKEAGASKEVRWAGTQVNEKHRAKRSSRLTYTAIYTL